jgi:hypothetical protein
MGEHMISILEFMKNQQFNPFKKDQFKVKPMFKTSLAQGYNNKLATMKPMQRIIRPKPFNPTNRMKI